MKIWCQIPVKMPPDDPSSKYYYESFVKHFDPVKSPDSEITLKDVPTSSWNHFWESFTGLRSFNNIEILKSVLNSEKEGFDGVIISCFLDPMLYEARQLLKIPVVGLAESAMHLACLMGSKFAIITKDKLFIPPMEAQIHRYGMESKAITRNPVRVLTIPEEELFKIEQGMFTGNPQDCTPLLENFSESAEDCIKDGAEVLIMGCGLLSPIIMQAGLLEVNGAVIIEPNHASLKMIEALAAINKAETPFISRKSLYADVPSQYIADVLDSSC